MSAHPDAARWFAEWWPSYWRRVAKIDAQRAFLKVCTSETLRDRIVAAVIAQAPAMLARDPRHRPHAASWLRGARWEDELDAPKPPKILSAHELFIARKQIEQREYAERQETNRKATEEYRARMAEGA